MSSVEEYLKLLSEEETPELLEPKTGSAVDDYFSYIEQKQTAQNIGNVRKCISRRR